jgi:hypothetical protein
MFATIPAESAEIVRKQAELLPCMIISKKLLHYNPYCNYSCRSATDMAANIHLKTAIFAGRTTQARVAQKVPMSESKLSRIIHGYHQPTEDEKRQIARILRRRITEIFPPEAVAS